MKIAILGSGAWGCTLAHHLSRLDSPEITLWEMDDVRRANLIEKRQPFGISEYMLSPSIRIIGSLEEVLDTCQVLVVVVPAQHVGSLLEKVAQTLEAAGKEKSDYKFLLASKGIDLKQRIPLSEFFQRFFPESPFAVISGPCIAREIASGIPTSVVVSSKDRAWADQLIEQFSSQTLRCYFQPDVLGVELGGALKNCIAIAAGISDGLGFGENTKSALLSRGLAEISRLAVSLGAGEQTIYGLAGLGDLAVTCFSPHSRNRTFGELLGKGKTADEARTEIRMVVEGEQTARAALELARQGHIEVPIIQAVVNVCDGIWSPAEAVGNLMNRELKEEF